MYNVRLQDQYLLERNIIYDKGQCKQMAYVCHENTKAKIVSDSYVMDRSSATARIAMLQIKPKDVVIYESEQISCLCRCCTLNKQLNILAQEDGVFEAIKLLY